jgi:hypothetical protein
LLLLLIPLLLFLFLPQTKYSLSCGYDFLHAGSFSTLKKRVSGFFKMLLPVYSTKRHLYL